MSEIPGPLATLAALARVVAPVVVIVVGAALNDDDRAVVSDIGAVLVVAGFVWLAALAATAIAIRFVIPG